MRHRMIAMEKGIDGLVFSRRGEFGEVEIAMVVFSTVCHTMLSDKNV